MLVLTNSETTNKKYGKPSFYISRVGQVGKPMKKLTYNACNVYAVYSDDVNNDFQRVKAAYELGMFAIFGIGSCQPAIRIGDVRNVIDNLKPVDENLLNGMAAIQLKIDMFEKQLELHKQLLKATQFKAFR